MSADHMSIRAAHAPDANDALRLPNARPLLEVRQLTVQFETLDGTIRPVEGVSFALGRGEKLGLVGESGCGKSVTALSIMRLLPTPPARITEGEVFYDGRNLLALSEPEIRRLRGDRLAMVFQEPMSALNPLHTVGDQIAEVLRIHRGLSRREAFGETVRLLEKVQIPEASRRAHDYPHQMSGGMRQRAMIAMALACNPDLLIADEPTTALDVTVQAQILALLERLAGEYRSSVLLITHDMGIVAELCDRVAIMYAGQIVEIGRLQELFDRPLHPYTQGLLRSLPTIDDFASRRKLYTIPGSVPDPQHFPPGCRFHPRCEFATEECRQEAPDLMKVGDEHQARCWHWERIEKERRVSLKG
ncbi:MAG: ABC transporter ATP-binding protein [Candidatus Sumerlaeaceae bacterium]